MGGILCIGYLIKQKIFNVEDVKNNEGRHENLTCYIEDDGPGWLSG